MVFTSNWRNNIRSLWFWLRYTCILGASGIYWNSCWTSSMINQITIRDVEITICGCTFIVDYRYYAEIPSGYLHPTDPAEVEILKVSIKGQPEGDAETLLEAIKSNMRHANYRIDGIDYDTGYYLLEQQILENPPL